MNTENTHCMCGIMKIYSEEVNQYINIVPYSMASSNIQWQRKLEISERQFYELNN